MSLHFLGIFTYSFKTLCGKERMRSPLGEEDFVSLCEKESICSTQGVNSLI